MRYRGCARLRSGGPRIQTMNFDLGLGAMMMRAHLRIGLAAAIAVVGCSGYDSDYTYMNDDVPSGLCDTDGETDGCSGGTGEGSTTRAPDGGPGSPCGRSGECDEGLACSAPFSQGERGELACVEACIQNMDELRWCVDADGCCDPGAVCSMRGYCIGSGDPDDTTGDDSTGGDSTGDDSTGDDSTGGDSTGSSTGGEQR
jgi:hypothetical protein